MEHNSKWQRASQYSVVETLDRLEEVISQNAEILIIGRIDQGQVIRDGGGEARETQMLLFENRRLVSMFYQIGPAGLMHFPIKALAWEDAEGQVHIRVTDPQILGRETDLPEGHELIKTIDRILGDMLDLALQADCK